MVAECHEIEIYKDMAAFASRRVPAWHVLGTVFQEDVTGSEILELAHSDKWNVRCIPVSLPGRSDKTYYAVVRTNPFDGHNDVLGMGGERYTPVQNEDLVEFGDAIGGARWETFGSLKGGSQVFGSLALDHDIVIDPTGVRDVINSYLLLSTSHDGSLSIQASITNVRVVCRNTLNLALLGTVQTAKVRHTKNANDRLAEAHRVLDLSERYNKQFAVEAKALFESKVTDAQFFQIVEALYPKPTTEAKVSQTKWDNKVVKLSELWNGETQVGIKGTGWGALNALTERLDWFRNPHKGNAENAYAAASGFDAAANAEKNRILSAVKELVLV